MLITLTEVTKGPKHSALPPTTLRFTSGAVTLAPAETERRPTVLGLIASGRMRPDSGTVQIDGGTDYSGIRGRIALVDALGVSDPAADVTVAEVVAEELMFAGRIGHRRAVSRVLTDLGLADQARSDMADLAPRARIRLLAELAVMRGGVEGLVLTSPDRHGGDPLDWWAAAAGLAGRGYAVLVIAGKAAAGVVAERAAAEVAAAVAAEVVAERAAPTVAAAVAASVRDGAAA